MNVSRMDQSMVVPNFEKYNIVGERLEEDA